MNRQNDMHKITRSLLHTEIHIYVEYRARRWNPDYLSCQASVFLLVMVILFSLHFHIEYNRSTSIRTSSFIQTRFNEQLPWYETIWKRIRHLFLQPHKPLFFNFFFLAIFLHFIIVSPLIHIC